MHDIASFLPSVLKKNIAGRFEPVLEILGPLWSQVVGRIIAHETRPVSFSAGTLTLGTSCPTWAIQLRHMSEDLRSQINNYLGRPVVKKLRIREGAKLDSNRAGRDSHQLPPFRSEPAILTASAEEWEGTSSELDPELARIVEHSFVKYFAASRRRSN